jgi:CRISPR-associated protein Cmr2
MLNTLAEKFYAEAKDLIDIRYTLADTRVPYVSLSDHLILTSGMAVSMLKELLGRGKSALDICGEPFGSDDLVQIARIASLLHDIGKVEGYRGHVERGARMARYRLADEPLPSSVKEIIIRAVERHQLDYSPESLLEKIVCLADSMASAGDRPQLQRQARNYQELERMAGRNLDLERDIFGDQPGLALILGDVDRIKSYVFETSKLPEIRGASEILNDLNFTGVPHMIAQHLAPECVIYAGGGSFLAITPVSIATILIDEVSSLFLRTTHVATITCVKSQPLRYLDFAKGHEPYVDDEVKNIGVKAKGVGSRLLSMHPVQIDRKRGFGEIMSFLATKLKQAKESRPLVPFVETLPIMRRCSYCGLRPAQHEIESRDVQGRDALCGICWTRRQQGAQSQKQRFAEEFRKWVGEYGNQEVGARAPAGLDELDGVNSYVGFLYADGNDIGALLEEKAMTPAAFRHIAEVLKQETRNSLFEALYETLKLVLPERQILPFEIVNIGGDDVTLFVNARWAWEAAVRFLEAFERRTRELATELGVTRLTAAVGLCLTKSSYPVYYAERLADSLLKLAKRRAKENRDNYESAICHLYLTSSLAAEDAGEVLKAYNIDPKRRLTTRPYTLMEARGLEDVASALSALFSRSQFHALAQALEQGLFASSNFLFYQLSRVTDSQRDEQIARLKEALSRLGCDPQFLIWKADAEGTWSTYLYDALELVKMQGGVW